MRRFAGVLLSVGAMAIARSTIVLVVAQESAARFEVASVKPNVSADLTIPISPLPPDGIVLTNFPLYEVIRYAYDVQPFRLEGTPGWTHDERFDIAAKAAAVISDTERRLMMRTLLVERFHLKSHVETHEKTTHLMTLARSDKQLGPGVKPRPDCAAAPCEPSGGSSPDRIRVTGDRVDTVC